MAWLVLHSVGWLFGLGWGGTKPKIRRTRKKRAEPWLCRSRGMFDKHGVGLQEHKGIRSKGTLRKWHRGILRVPCAGRLCSPYLTYTIIRKTLVMWGLTTTALQDLQHRWALRYIPWSKTDNGDDMLDFIPRGRVCHIFWRNY